MKRAFFGEISGGHTVQKQEDVRSTERERPRPEKVEIANGDKSFGRIAEHQCSGAIHENYIKIVDSFVSFETKSKHIIKLRSGHFFFHFLRI
jgi:hypothetical protein